MPSNDNFTINVINRLMKFNIYIASLITIFYNALGINTFNLSIKIKAIKLNDKTSK